MGHFFKLSWFGGTIPLLMQKGKYDFGHVKKNFRWKRHLLMEATIRFDGESAFRIYISCLVTISGRWHFEIGKMQKRSTEIYPLFSKILII